MFRLNYLIATCVLALTVGTANANTVTFDATGTFDSASSGINLSGTLTVDVTTGLIPSGGVNLQVTGFNPFNILVSSPSVAQPLQAESSDHIDYLYLSFSPSLIGYNGGPIQSGSTVEVDTSHCDSCDRHTLFSGSFTPELATTPLPAALPLFATGLGALGLLGWRRKRKAAALAA
jgi:hypothetical protein